MTDYAAVQAEIAQRVERDANCRACLYRPYTLEAAVDVDDPDWQPCTNMAAMVRPCDVCKTRRPYTWVADINSTAFVAWCQAHPYAFLVDELRVLLTTPEPKQPADPAPEA